MDESEQDSTGVSDIQVLRAEFDRLAVIAQSFVDAFVGVARQILTSPVWEQLQALVRQIEAKTPDPQRLRHGHAAYCPLHGEMTRGGLCRRCARSSR